MAINISWIPESRGKDHNVSSNELIPLSFGRLGLMLAKIMSATTATKHTHPGVPCCDIYNGLGQARFTPSRKISRFPDNY